MKFKEGDKVRVRKDLKFGKRYYMDDHTAHNVAMVEMVSLAGKVVTIQCENCGGQYRVKEDKNHYSWVDEMFEDVAKHEPIVIYQKDEKTVVALDKNTGEEAKAVCSDDDEFGFYEGAKIAFSRLKRGRRLVVGDKIIANEKASNYSITKPGWIGKVIRFTESENFMIVAREKGEAEFYVRAEAFDLYDGKEQSKFKPWSAVDTEDMRRELVKFCHGRGCFDCVFCSLNCGFSSMGDDELRLAYALAKQVYKDKE